MFAALRRYTGWFLLIVLLLYYVSILSNLLSIVVAILAWLVVILEWSRLPANSRKQTYFLLAVGIGALLFSARQGVFLGWQKIMTQNLPLLPMFIAVSFLALTNPAVQDNLPKGKRAIITTSISTNLLGAVINLSILFVFGDRLERNNTLTKAQTILLARPFCAAAWWSPFYIAAGVALTYAPDMQYYRTLLPGLVMCWIAISYSIVEVGFIRRGEFTGYPVRKESLAIPIILAMAVITGHYFFPEVSMILLISIISPPAAILLMRNRPRLVHLRNFINNRIISTVSQFVLFLAAGVFSIGITSIIQVYPELFNLSENSFSRELFAMISALLIILGLIGVHPMVGIAIASPLLLPLAPDNSQLAFMFLTSWAISTGSSPLSGVGLVLTSRYNVSPRSILVSNFHYVVAMWIAANLVNILYFG